MLMATVLASAALSCLGLASLGLVIESVREPWPIWLSGDSVGPGTREARVGSR